MTEKQYAPTKTEMKATKAVKTPKQKNVEVAPVKKAEKVEEILETKELEKNIKDKVEEKVEEKKTEVKKKIEKRKGPKKTEAVVNSFSLPISTKTSVAICKFIKGKTIEKATKDLEQVVVAKKAVPMKGEIPHRKGEGMMSGRFPKRAAEHFIVLLKTLKGNSNVNELDSPIIVETIANLASRPFGRFGRMRKKRTHVSIRVREKKLISKAKKKGKKINRVNKKKK